MAVYWPAAVALLKGLQAASHQLRIELPPESVPYFSNLDKSELDDADLPISWAIPLHADLVELFSEVSTDTEQTRVELGNLIKEWNRSSLAA